MLGSEDPMTLPKGRVGSSSKWGVIVAALLVLGGCAEQATETEVETPSTLRRSPIPSFTRPATHAALPDMSQSCFVLERTGAFADDAPGFKSEECQQRFTSWRDARRAARSVETTLASALSGGVCSVTGHDVVVSTIGDLRAAVASSAPGTVIGIDGLLDINDDGGGDVVVTSEGITLTCASNGAGLVGLATEAVLQVLAPQVRVEMLDITALPETGAGDRSRGVRVEGDGGVVSHNRVACERTCIFFGGVSGGTAEYNDITAGFKSFGFAVVNGQDVVVRNNMVGDCFRCVEFDDHANGIVENNQLTSGAFGVIVFGVSNFSIAGNTIGECFFACVGSLSSFAAPTSNLSIQDNHLSGCGDMPFTEGCVWLDALDGGLVQGNDIHGDPTAAAVRLTDFGGPSTDVIVHDNLAEGSLWTFFSERISLTENTVSNCAGSCVLVYFAPEAEVHGNHVTGSAADNVFVGIDGTQSPGLSVVRNTLRGSFQSRAIQVENWDPQPDVEYLISGNDIAIEASEFGTGISLQSVSNSQIDNNKIDLGDGGPSSTGIVLSGAAGFFREVVNGEVVFEFSLFFPVTDNVFATNRISGAGVGLFVNGACTNTFVGNDLARNERDAVFTLASRFIETDPYDPNREFIYENDGTGANTLAGNGNAVVEETYYGDPVADSGYLDCDMDGVRDPNIYSGTGRLQRGGLGAVVGKIMSQLSRPTMEELAGG